ncbi:unnamed protein product, partial [Chrysoparadoxa australica]
PLYPPLPGALESSSAFQVPGAPMTAFICWWHLLIAMLSLHRAMGFIGSSGLRAPSSFPRMPSSRCPPTAGLKITVRIRGKKGGGEPWLEEGYNMYAQRLRPVLALDTQWHKSDDDLIAAVRKEEERQTPVICLDERGKQVDSIAFSKLMYKKLEDGGSRLCFVIGGAEGLPAELKQKRDAISLGKMVFTHTWARAILAEQVYRATEIRKGSKYHK